MKAKSIDQVKAEYQQSVRVAAEKRAIRDAAKVALNEAQDAFEVAESNAEQQAIDLLQAIRIEALKTGVAPSSPPIEPSPAPIYASNLKRGESLRLAPGQSIVFDGGAELSFPTGRFLTNAEVARLAQTIRDAKGGSSEPPPSTM